METNTTKTIEIRPEHRRLMYAASKDKTRYNLTGIYYDRERGNVVATTGHIMAMAPIGDISETTPSGIVDGLSPEPKKGASNKFQSISADSRGYLDVETGEIIVPSNDQFPDYMQVMPDKDRKEIKVTFNPEKLLAVCKALQGKQREHCVTLRIDANNPELGTILVSCPRSKSTGLIMPMRTE